MSLGLFNPPWEPRILREPSRPSGVAAAARATWPHRERSPHPMGGEVGVSCSAANGERCDLRLACGPEALRIYSGHLTVATNGARRGIQ